jgi:hypothetical protein
MLNGKDLPEEITSQGSKPDIMQLEEAQALDAVSSTSNTDVEKLIELEFTLDDLLGVGWQKEVIFDFEALFIKYQCYLNYFPIRMIEI